MLHEHIFFIFPYINPRNTNSSTEPTDAMQYVNSNTYCQRNLYRLPESKNSPKPARCGTSVRTTDIASPIRTPVITCITGFSLTKPNTLSGSFRMIEITTGTTAITQYTAMMTNILGTRGIVIIILLLNQRTASRPIVAPAEPMMISAISFFLFMPSVTFQPLQHRLSGRR